MFQKESMKNQWKSVKVDERMWSGNVYIEYLIKKYILFN